MDYQTAYLQYLQSLNRGYELKNGQLYQNGYPVSGGEAYGIRQAFEQQNPQFAAPATADIGGAQYNLLSPEQASAFGPGTNAYNWFTSNGYDPSQIMQNYTDPNTGQSYQAIQSDPYFAAQKALQDNSFLTQAGDFLGAIAPVAAFGAIAGPSILGDLGLTGGAPAGAGETVLGTGDTAAATTGNYGSFFPDILNSGTTGTGLTSTGGFEPGYGLGSGVPSTGLASGAPIGFDPTSAYGLGSASGGSLATGGLGVGTDMGTLGAGLTGLSGVTLPGTYGSDLYGIPGAVGALSGLGSLLPKTPSPSGLDSLLSGLGQGIGSGNLLNTGLALAPSLAAIGYATNLPGYDTSRLENAYNQITPQALTGPYDLQTAAGRQSLTSNLARRNILGSSFANADLANYNMTRDVGRANLLGTAAGSQAGIAGQILNAQIANQQQKNDLYGRALLALSGGLSPTNTSSFAGLL